MHEHTPSKAKLKADILEQINMLSKIPQNFKHHNDSTLYNHTDDKVKIFLSILDTVDSQYYQKLASQLKETKNIILDLYNAEQNIV